MINRHLVIGSIGLIAIMVNPSNAAADLLCNVIGAAIATYCLIQYGRSL